MRTLAATALFFVAGLSLAPGVHRMAVRQEQAAFPPPGRMVDAGGHRLHLDCRGAGLPVVVLETGAGSSSLRWGPVQQRLSRVTTACAYDRAGLGWSEAGPLPRSLERLVRDAEVLFDASGQTPPYVWVGHSLGGLVARLYQSRNAERVAGLVLVDATHEEQWERLPPEVDTMLRRTIALMEAISRIAPAGAARLLRPLMPPPPGLPRSLVGPYRATTVQAHTFEAWTSEFSEARSRIPRDVAISPAALGDLPLGVVTAARSFDAFRDLAPDGFPFHAANLEWMKLQREFLTLSTASRHFVAPRATHEVTLDAPELVAQAILHVVAEVRNRRQADDPNRLP